MIPETNIALASHLLYLGGSLYRQQQGFLGLELQLVAEGVGGKHVFALLQKFCYSYP